MHSVPSALDKALPSVNSVQITSTTISLTVIAYALMDYGETMLQIFVNPATTFVLPVVDLLRLIACLAIPHYILRMVVA